MMPITNALSSQQTGSSFICKENTSLYTIRFVSVFMLHQSDAVFGLHIYDWNLLVYFLFIIISKKLFAIYVNVEQANVLFHACPSL